MDVATAYSVGGWIGAAIASAIIGFQAKKNAKLTAVAAKATTEKVVAETEKASMSCDQLLTAKEALLQSTLASCDWQTKAAEEYKRLFEATVAKNDKYREEWHIKDGKSNATILTLTNENAELRAQTNLSPILETLNMVVKTQQQIAAILRAFGKHLNIPNLELDYEHEKDENHHH